MRSDQEEGLEQAAGKEKDLARDLVFWYSLVSLIVPKIVLSARSVLGMVFCAPTRTSNNRVGKSGPMTSQQTPISLILLVFLVCSQVWISMFVTARIF